MTYTWTYQNVPFRQTNLPIEMSLDPNQRMLFKDGATVQLTLKETKLMAILLDNVGQVVTRERLIEAVWEKVDMSKSRTLDVHIHHLRRKVEDDPAIPEHILSRRGLGLELRL